MDLGGPDNLTLNDVVESLESAELTARHPEIRLARLIDVLRESPAAP